MISVGSCGCNVQSCSRLEAKQLVEKITNEYLNNTFHEKVGDNLHFFGLDVDFIVKVVDTMTVSKSENSILCKCQLDAKICVTKHKEN